MRLKKSLYPYLQVMFLYFFIGSVEAVQFQSQWIVDSIGLKELLKHQAKVVYLVNKPTQKPKDVIPGTDPRRVIPWQPHNEDDSFAVRVFSKSLSYPMDRKYPKAMPDSKQWTATMRRLGIDQGDLIIAVGNMEFATRFSRTVVEYGGHAVVYNDATTDNLLIPYSMVDPIPGNIEPGNFTARNSNRQRLSLGNSVGKRIDTRTRFWDVRNAVYPAGKKTKSYVYAQGTLSNASNALKYIDLLDDSGAWYRSADDVSAVFMSHFGDPLEQGSHRHIIVCDSEGLSNIVMWAARSLGYDNVFVLAGGLHEFTMDPKNHRYVSLMDRVGSPAK
ncbi:MAG: rhodanese-like domain-containing protein [Candidatus Thiodiazotropha sp.]